MAYRYGRKKTYRKRTFGRKRYARKRTYPKRTYRKRTYRRSAYRKKTYRKASRGEVLRPVVTQVLPTVAVQKLDAETKKLMDKVTDIAWEASQKVIFTKQEEQELKRRKKEDELAQAGLRSNPGPTAMSM